MEAKSCNKLWNYHIYCGVDSKANGILSDNPITDKDIFELVKESLEWCKNENLSFFIKGNPQGTSISLDISIEDQKNKSGLKLFGQYWKKLNKGDQESCQD
jgi:hypothetical protein